MREKQFIDHEIWWSLKYEYFKTVSNWYTFIKNKDMGILPFINMGGEASRSTYIITDPQKWMLAKIKYGI